MWMECIIQRSDFAAWIRLSLKGNLEGGIYDLTLAERFAPIDKDADGFRSWARYYSNRIKFLGN